LDFTTASHDELVGGYRYSYAEVSSAAEDLNYGAVMEAIFIYYPYSVMIKVYPKA